MLPGSVAARAAPRPLLPAGGGAGCPLPRRRRPSARDLAAAAARPPPQPPTPDASLNPQGAGGAFLKGGYPVPPPLPADPSPHPCNQPRESEGQRAGISGAGEQAAWNRRRFESRPACVRSVTLGHALTLSGLHTAQFSATKKALPSLRMWASWDGRCMVFLRSLLKVRVGIFFFFFFLLRPLSWKDFRGGAGGEGGASRVWITWRWGVGGGWWACSPGWGGRADWLFARPPSPPSAQSLPALPPTLQPGPQNCLLEHILLLFFSGGWVAWAGSSFCPR